LVTFSISLIHNNPVENVYDETNKGGTNSDKNFNCIALHSVAVNEAEVDTKKVDIVHKNLRLELNADLPANGVVLI
jgi:hypothetical protein